MDFLINVGGKITGIWSKISAFLPKLAGAGAVLVGAGDIIVSLSHAQSLAAAVDLLKGLNPQNPDVLMIVGGLTALGLHTNHQGLARQVNPPQVPPPAPKPQ